jgi:hypothetical protein
LRHQATNWQPPTIIAVEKLIRIIFGLSLLWLSCGCLEGQAYLYTFQGLLGESQLDGSFVVLSNAVPGSPVLQDLLQARILDNYGCCGVFDVSVSVADLQVTDFDAQGFRGTIWGTIQSYVGPTTVQLVGTDGTTGIFANNNGFYPGSPSGEGVYGSWAVTHLWFQDAAPLTNWSAIA